MRKCHGCRDKNEVDTESEDKRVVSKLACWSGECVCVAAASPRHCGALAKWYISCYCSAGRLSSLTGVCGGSVQMCVRLCVWSARWRGVMHVFNNSPLALCVCVCVCVRAPLYMGWCLHACVHCAWSCPCVETCWKWTLMARESEPSVLLFRAAPTGTGRAPAGLLPVISHPQVHWPRPYFSSFPSFVFTFPFPFPPPSHTVTSPLFWAVSRFFSHTLCPRISGP